MVWPKAHPFVLAAYRLTRTLPRSGVGPEARGTRELNRFDSVDSELRLGSTAGKHLHLGQRILTQKSVFERAIVGFAVGDNLDGILREVCTIEMRRHCERGRSYVLLLLMLPLISGQDISFRSAFCRSGSFRGASSWKPTVADKS